MNNVNFDFSSISATKAATFNQIKFRAGNIGVALLFSDLGLKNVGLKSTNYRLFKQMGKSIETATMDKPLTHGDIQEMGTNPAKFSDIFREAFKHLLLKSDELVKLLQQDKVSEAKIKKVILKFNKLKGLTDEKSKKSTTIQTRKITKKEPVKISTKPTKSNNSESKPLTAAQIQRQIDKLFLALEQLD